MTTLPVVLFLGLICIIPYLFVSASFDPLTYPNKQTLSPGIFTLFWRVDEATEDIFFAFEVKTTGYISFGIGEPTSGSMGGSDMVWGFVDDMTGRVEVSDMYCTKTGVTPIKDSCQHWKIVSGGQSNTTTIIEVTRKLDTQDQNDRVITSGVNRIVAAWGTNDKFSYHGQNRVASVAVFYGDSPLTPPSGTKKESFIANDFEIPAKTTTYVCQYTQLQNLTKVHAVMFEPVIDNKDYVHHMLFHDCSGMLKIPESRVLLESWKGAGAECESPQGIVGCRLVWAWAKGGLGYKLPENVGVPMGGPLDATDMVVEIHYDNPSLDAGIRDNSGVAVFTTTNLRPIEAGIISIGDPVLALKPIPAGTSDHHIETSCSPACTTSDKWIEDEITVIGSFLHMHEYGSSIYTNITRDGNTVASSNHIDFWDFAFQQFTPVNYTVSRGDRINLHCNFDAASSSIDIVFGTASSQEMCQAYLMYYPAMPRMRYCGLADSENLFCGGLQDIVASVSPPLANTDETETRAITFIQEPTKCPDTSINVTDTVIEPANTPSSGSTDTPTDALQAQHLLLQLLHQTW